MMEEPFRSSFLANDFFFSINTYVLIYTCLMFEDTAINLITKTIMDLVCACVHVCSFTNMQTLLGSCCQGFKWSQKLIEIIANLTNLSHFLKLIDSLNAYTIFL